MTTTPSSHHNVDPTPVLPIRDDSRKDSHRSVSVLLATMALTLMLAIVFITLAALETPVDLNQASALLVGTSA